MSKDIFFLVLNIKEPLKKTSNYQIIWIMLILLIIFFVQKDTYITFLKVKNNVNIIIR